MYQVPTLSDEFTTLANGAVDAILLALKYFESYDLARERRV